MSLKLQGYNHRLLFDGYKIFQEEEWDFMFQELAEYKENNGDCNVTGETTELGQWVAAQRELFRVGNLEYNRVKQLAELGFLWSLQEVSTPPKTQPTLNATFEAKLQMAAEYIRAQGHGWIPSRTPEYPGLGIWASNIRKMKRKRRLSLSNKLALEKIGFLWGGKPSNPLHGFEAMLKATAEYIRVQGHGWVPSHTPEFPKLGSWAAKQRSWKRQGTLSASQTLALESIGFLWEPPFFNRSNDSKFEAMLRQTAEYIIVQGHGWVPHLTPEFPKLGHWAKTQRTQKRAGKLSTSRQLALENIGFVWDSASFDAKFEAMLQATAEYIQVQGHGWVPERTPEFPKLGKWAQTQRSLKRTGKLSTSRQLALDNIGFIWDLPSIDAKFEAMLRQTAEYIRVQGHGWVSSTPEFPKLGHWARTQRSQKRTGQLSASRQSALESIGFVWEKPKNASALVDGGGAKLDANQSALVNDGSSFEAMLLAAECIRIHDTV